MKVQIIEDDLIWNTLSSIVSNILYLPFLRLKCENQASLFQMFLLLGPYPAHNDRWYVAGDSKHQKKITWWELWVNLMDLYQLRLKYYCS